MSPLEGFVQTYGVPAVLIGTFFEGETILVLAGLAAHRGYLPMSSVIAAAFAGTFLGDQLYFHLGRRHAGAVEARWPAWQERIARAQRVLERHHVAFILGFRFLYGLRMVSPFAIGMSDVPLPRYVVLNALGGLVWSVAFALLGYTLGHGAEALLGRIQEIEGWLFLSVAVAGPIVWWLHRARSARGDPTQ